MPVRIVTFHFLVPFMVVHPHRAFPHLSDDLVVTVALPLLRIMVSNTWTIRWKIKHTLNDETPSLDTVSWGTQNISLNRWTVSQLPGTCPEGPRRDL